MHLATIPRDGHLPLALLRAGGVPRLVAVGADAVDKRMGLHRVAAGAAELGVTLRQPVLDRHPLVENEALAAEGAFGLRHDLEIFEDAALEVEHLLETLRQQVARGLLATDA